MTELGEFDTTTGLAFMAEGDTAFITNPGSGLVQKFRLTTGEVMASLQLDPGVGPAVVSPNRLFLVVLGVAEPGCDAPQRLASLPTHEGVWVRESANQRIHRKRVSQIP